MLTRTSVLLGCLTVVVLAGCGRQFTAPEDSPLFNVVRTGELFILAPGEEIGIEGTDLRLRFVQVTEESRCPTGAECVIAGTARILLRTADDRGQQDQFTLSIPGLVEPLFTRNGLVSHRGLRFQLVQLDPYPELGRPPAPQEAYRAHLIVRP